MLKKFKVTRSTTGTIVTCIITEGSNTVSNSVKAYEPIAKDVKAAEAGALHLLSELKKALA